MAGNGASEKPTVIDIGVVGVGGVGKAFLLQLEQLQHRVSRPTASVHLRLVLVQTRSKALYDKGENGINISHIPEELKNSKQPPLDTQGLISTLGDRKAHARVLVDNTSDLNLASSYPDFLGAGISVVTPNKKAFSDSYDLWERIFSGAANGKGHPGLHGYVFHESSVGAGLPVISTLNDLVDTGDKVERIEGVFSGTMSFLFNNFMPVGGGGGLFSDEVKKAKELGYTEPDPRDDLNGLDVARKLTILARIAGLRVESPTSFPVQSLIPSELESCKSGDEFLQRLPEFDSRMDEVKASAAKEGKVVRFVGSIDVAKQEVKVGLEKFGADHPIAGLKGSDNIMNFYTKRYGSNPLIVQGAGAGADVTAMGVLSDLLKVIRIAQGPARPPVD